MIAENNLNNRTKKTTKKDNAENETNRPHVLLLDEPELCLHPNAVREACRVLYALPVTGNLQVIVTTHSPVFIDVSRDNTTIIKVKHAVEWTNIGQLEQLVATMVTTTLIATAAEDQSEITE